MDVGSESYERKLTRMLLKAAAIGLFLIVAWKILR